MTVRATDDIWTCIALRRAVFMDEQGISEADEMDGRDHDATHFLAWHEGDAVGTARVFVSGDTVKIGRVCVLASARGTGLGRALILGTMQWAREQGLSRAQLSAQTYALGFYQSLGFEQFGPIYDDAGIPHQDKARAL